MSSLVLAWGGIVPRPYRFTLFASTATPGGDTPIVLHTLHQRLGATREGRGKPAKGGAVPMLENSRRRPRAPNHPVGYRFGIVS